MRFRELKDRIQKHGVVAIDLETKAPAGEKDSLAKDPRHAQLEMIALASGRGSDYHTLAVDPIPEAVGFVQECLSSPGLRVVGHNLIRFDLRVLHHLGIFNLRDIRSKIIDTLPLSWLLNEEIPHGLKFLVNKVFRYQMVEYDQAFLASPAIRQIEASERVIRDLEKYRDEARKILKRERSKEKKRLLEELKSKIDGKTKEGRKEIKEYKDKIDRYLENRFDTKAEEAINARIDGQIEQTRISVAHLQAQADRDKRRYAADDAKQSLRLYYYCRRRAIEENIAIWADREMMSTFGAASMECDGIHVDPKRLRDLDEIFIPLVSEFEAEVFNHAHMEFNPNSPEQVAHVLYDVLGLPDRSESRKTNVHHLSRLGHPIGQAILNYRTVSKLRSTYVTKLIERAEADPENRIYALFNPIGTVTGRGSSSRPNLQNIPSRKKPKEYDERIQGLGPRIRTAFTAPPGRKLICADLSQIELRLIAYVTGDSTLLQVYSEHVVHDDILYYTGDVHEVTRQMVSKLVGYDIGRKLAKNLNFGLAYGLQAKGFAKYANLLLPDKSYDVDKAGTFRDAFMSSYVGLPKMISFLEQAWVDGQRNFNLISGRKRHFRKYDDVSPGKILNSIIQGSAADILKCIISSLWTNIVRAGVFGEAKLITQVHDEIALEVPKEAAENLGILTKYIMELPWFDIPVPVLASVKVCDDWSENNDDDVPEVGHLPPPEANIKASVSMLSEEQRIWASQYVHDFQSYSIIQEEEETVTQVSVDEYLRMKANGEA